MTVRANGPEGSFTESQDLFAQHINKHALEYTIMCGVHVEFTTLNSS